MAKSSVRQEEIAALISRLEWQEEERRKTLKAIASLEQRIQSQEELAQERKAQIAVLNEKLSQKSSEMIDFRSLGQRIDSLRDELVQMVREASASSDRLVREKDQIDNLERAAHVREVSELRKDLSNVGQWRNSLDLLQAEDARLARMIGTLEGKIVGVESSIESWSQQLKLVESAQRTRSDSRGEFQNSLMELSRRVEAASGRIEAVSEVSSKAQTKMQNLSADLEKIRGTISRTSEEENIAEHDRNRRFNEWSVKLQSQVDQVKKIQLEWPRFSTQHRESRELLASLELIKEKLEQQQRETSELLRVESSRLRSEWEQFAAQSDKVRSQRDVANDQRWSTFERREKDLLRLLETTRGDLGELRRAIATIHRVQEAQTETMRQLPRVWLQNVERASKHDPDERRNPANVTITEE